MKLRQLKHRAYLWGCGMISRKEQMVCISYIRISRQPVHAFTSGLFSEQPYLRLNGGFCPSCLCALWKITRFPDASEALTSGSCSFDYLSISGIKEGSIAPALASNTFAEESQALIEQRRWDGLEKAASAGWSSSPFITPSSIYSPPRLSTTLSLQLRG